MLKAKALCAVEGNAVPENRPLMSVAEKPVLAGNTGDGSRLKGLVSNMQNMVIESVGDDDTIPGAVSQLAIKIMKNNGQIKDLLLELRQHYIRGQKEFHLSLAGRSESERMQIISLFQEMAGLISSVRYCSESQSLNGTLLITPKAQNFLSGQYLELAVYETIRNVLQELAVQYKTEYEIYRNVRVATREGKAKNEFDTVIYFGGIFYVVECKSGKNFNAWDSFAEIGRTYGIVPDRLLLVDSFVSDDRAECIEYFCNYYVCNLSSSSLREKVTNMISNDFAA
ncbi:MAG: hypothetical protein ACOYBL_09660 [Lachnospiraceae bacterium]